jgi:hypothetical protein
MRDRRSDFDVTNTVQVSDPDAVRTAVRSIWTSLYPDTDFAPIASAFDQFTRAFRGDSDRYHPIETTYHDLQHTLDVTLAMARLVDGYERSPQTRARRLGATRAAVGLITALFHDAGYLRRINDTRHEHGAEYTRIHVSRSADIIADLLPEFGFADAAPVACEMVHYTGYERSFDSLEIDDPLWRKTGHLLGTADMLAQMADRCYLEKCRDRLYDEFVKGGMARMRAPDGRIVVNYESPHHLLRKTPDFCRATLEQRIGQQFEHAERFFEVHFDGRNLYMDAIERNLAHLEWVLEEDRWDHLRRKPLCYNVDYFKDGADGRDNLLLH